MWQPCELLYTCYLLTYLLLPRLCTSVVFIESESVVFVAPLDAASESSSKDDRSKTGEASSIDLEWEHEAGLFVCTLHCFLLLVCVCVVVNFCLGERLPAPVTYQAETHTRLTALFPRLPR